MSPDDVRGRRRGRKLKVTQQPRDWTDGLVELSAKPREDLIREVRDASWNWGR